MFFDGFSKRLLKVIFVFYLSKKAIHLNVSVRTFSSTRNKFCTFHKSSGMSNAGWAIASSKIPRARSVSDNDLSNSAYLLQA